MNLQRPNSNDATRTSNRSRSVVPMSGLCTRCVDNCTGNCEVFKASFRGRELIYPGPFGEITAGGDKDYPLDYSHLNIQGYALGANGLPDGVVGGPDTATFPSVNTETSYGWDKLVKMKVPIFTGALGSTEIARKHWDHFAVGAAISGVTLVCGENVCGIDPEPEFNEKGMVKKLLDMDRRIEIYKRYTRPSRIKGDLPPELDALIDSCLEPDPEKRLHTVGEFKQRLDAIRLSGVKSS